MFFTSLNASFSDKLNDDNFQQRLFFTTGLNNYQSDLLTHRSIIDQETYVSCQVQAQIAIHQLTIPFSTLRKSKKWLWRKRGESRDDSLIMGKCRIIHDILERRNGCLTVRLYSVAVHVDTLCTMKRKRATVSLRNI